MDTVVDRDDPSQAGERITGGAGGSVQPSQPFAGKTKSFATYLLPDSGTTLAHGGAEAGPAAQGASGGEKRAPIAGVAPTLADLLVLWGGRDRLLRVAEVAEHLGVCNATVYRLCERGELPHVWVVNSIRIRPSDLQAFLEQETVGGERGDG
jgi:excisionase family DNA binding protein